MLWKTLFSLTLPTRNMYECADILYFQILQVLDWKQKEFLPRRFRFLFFSTIFFVKIHLTTSKKKISFSTNFFFFSRRWVNTIIISLPRALSFSVFYHFDQNLMKNSYKHTFFFTYCYYTTMITKKGHT